MNKYALSIASATVSAGIVMGIMSCSSFADTPAPAPSSDAPHITRGTRNVNPTPTIAPVTPTEVPAPVITANPRPVQETPVIVTPAPTPVVTRNARPVNDPPVIVTPTPNLCGVK